MRKIWYSILRLFLKTVKVRGSYLVGDKQKFFTIENINHGGINIEFEDPKVTGIIAGKNIKEALGKFFPGKETRIKQIETLLQTLNGLSLIQADLKRSERYLRAVRFKAKNEITEGLLVAAMITYMKTFTSSNGRMQMRQDIIPAQLQHYHEQIKGVRDKYLSHADLAASFELSDNFIIIDDKQFIVMNPMLQTLRIFEARTMLKPLLKFLGTHVDGLVHQTRQEAEFRLNKLNGKKVEP